MKKSIIALALITASSSVFAVNVEKDNYVSIGASSITASTDYDKATINGFGFNWNQIEQGSNWGFGMGMDMAFNDYSMYGVSVAEVMWDVNLNVPYRFESADWLVIYPTVGMSFYTASVSTKYAKDSASEIGFNFGIGTMIQIPKTNFFVEANYKMHSFSDMGDSNLSSTYIGLGYKF